MGRRSNPSRAPRATKGSVLRRSFIIDMTRADGRRFITSVSDRDRIQVAMDRADGTVATVSHWEQRSFRDEHSLEGWHLVERFSL